MAGIALENWNETIRDPKIECMSRDEMSALQSERLVKQVKNVYDNVAFYRKKMDELGVEPGDIKGIEDIHKLPFTTKEDLRDNYPFGLLAVPQEKIARVQGTSGTTGKLTLASYTQMYATATGCSQAAWDWILEQRPLGQWQFLCPQEIRSASLCVWRTLEQRHSDVRRPMPFILQRRHRRRESLTVFRLRQALTVQSPGRMRCAKR